MFLYEFYLFSDAQRFSFSPKSLWPSGRQMFRVKTPTAGSCCSSRNWKHTQQSEPGEWPRRNHVNTNPVIIIIFQSAVIQITYKIISVRSSACRKKLKKSCRVSQWTHLQICTMTGRGRCLHLFGSTVQILQKKHRGRILLQIKLSTHQHRF